MDRTFDVLCEASDRGVDVFGQCLQRFPTAGVAQIERRKSVFLDRRLHSVK
jgi:hypothetical protein